MRFSWFVFDTYVFVTLFVTVGGRDEMLFWWCLAHVVIVIWCYDMSLCYFICSFLVNFT